MDDYDVIVIGAGISGLTAAALLAKRERKTAVIEAQSKPGGSCGIFKRNGVIFEQGAAMLYGFGGQGFNPHRYVFNALETPITMIHHKELYAIQYGEHRIVFPESIPEFVEELGRVFPDEKDGIRAFYEDMEVLYQNVISTTPVFQSPDVLLPKDSSKQFRQHPFSYLKFLSYMNVSVERMLKKYVKGTEILQFFDKLTSTYCYATVEEAPAVLGAVMFVDNHCGGSYYPAGSTMMLTGLLEKVIEENGGDCYYHSEAVRIDWKDRQVSGVTLSDGRSIRAKQIIYSGNVWSLYDDLLKLPMRHRYEPTYSSVVYYALVRRKAIPESAFPIEMLITDKSALEESEVTVYILSKDDTTLCPHDQHVVVAIGPSFLNWPTERGMDYHSKEYEEMKLHEQERILGILEQRFPLIGGNIIYQELATPSSLVRHTYKYHGAVAGPKQMLGQNLVKRQHTRTAIHGLYCCGEGTVMGTGTPAVTVSGIAAANLALREAGLPEYTWEDGAKDYVKIVNPPYPIAELSVSSNQKVNQLAALARRCQFCENPSCMKGCPKHIPIRDIHRRLAVGNLEGAFRQFDENAWNACRSCANTGCEQACICKEENKVPIHEIMTRLGRLKAKNG